MQNKISHDKDGRKVFPDSILYDVVANEFFIPVKKGSQWGDEFLGDFYPLNPPTIAVIKMHGTMKDLHKMMQHPINGATYNVSGDFDD